MKAIIQRIRTAAILAVLFAIGLASTAWAATKTNPVTGKTETYVNTYTGTNGSWNEAGNWDTGFIPYVSGGKYTSALVDGGGTETAVACTDMDGWTMQLGIYGGAKVTVSNLAKWTGGNGTDYATVDADSKLTITSMVGNNWNHVVNYYVASPGGITYKCAFAPANDAATIQYNLAGNGSVVYESTVNKAGHLIKAADVTLTGTSQVSSKTLVSFTSSTKTFTADAAIKVYDTDGTTLKKLVGVTAVRQSGATIANTSSALTPADAVGTCEIVQCTDGIVLYYVDGAPSAVTGYTPSININFCFGTAPLTTAADVGYSDYAVPGTSWNNMTSTSPASGNGTFTTPLTTVYAVKADGTTSLVSGASVALSGTPGSYRCNSLAAATDLRHGYIDENANNTAPTVTVSGIPYDKYKVVVYTSTDTADSAFGYVSVNGTSYTYVNNELAEGTAAWGASGAADSANAIAEGVNMLVTPTIFGETATIVGHKSNGRGCIAAIQIVEATPNATTGTYTFSPAADTTTAITSSSNWDNLPTGRGEDITISISGDATINVDRDMAFGTITIASTSESAATLTFAGSCLINATRVRVPANVTVKVDSAVSGTPVLNAPVVLSDATATLEIAAPATISKTISGSGKVAVSANPVVFTAENTFSGGLAIKSGGIAKTTVPKGFGGTGTNPQVGYVTVEGGGAVDVNNAYGAAIYHLSLAGTGVNGCGAAFNSGGDIGTNERQVSSITLTGDAKVICNNTWGLIASGHGATTLSLGSYKLTIAGNSAKTFWFVNTTVSGSGSIEVDNGGSITTSKNASTVGNDVSLVVKDGGALKVTEHNLTAKTITCEAGGTVEVSSNRTLNIQNGGTFTVNGTANISGQTNIGQTGSAGSHLVVGGTVNVNGSGVIKLVSTSDITKTGNGVINIAANAQVWWIDCSWTTSNAGDIFRGDGTLSLDGNGGNWSYYPNPCAFPGTLKIVTRNGTSDYHAYYAYFSGDPSGFTARPTLLLACGTEAAPGSVQLGSPALGKTMSVRDLNGHAVIYPWASSSGTFTIDTLQRSDTSFNGIFVQYAANQGISALTVRGETEATQTHSLTLTKASTTTGAATVRDNAKLIFDSTGSWENGTVTVADGGYLEVNNSGSVASTLDLQSGGTIVIQTVTTTSGEGDAATTTTSTVPISAGTVTFPDSGEAVIDISAIPDLASDESEAIINAATSLDLDVSKIRLVGKPYSLSVDGNALKVVNDGGLVWDSTNGWGTKDATKYDEATITSPGTVALGGTSLSFDTLTLTGSGTVSFSRTGDETISVGNIVIGSGVTLDVSAALDLTGATISGDGTLNIPAGTTYSMDDVNCSAKITCAGTLETSGATTLSSTATTISGTIDVLSGTTTLATAKCGITGTVTIEPDAWLSSPTWDALDYNGTTTLNVYGTINLQDVWSFASGNTLNFYNGCTITDAGNSHIASYDLVGGPIYVKPGKDGATGTVDLSAVSRLRANTVVNVEEGMTFTVSGQLNSSGEGTGFGFTKQGSGIFNLTPSSMAAFSGTNSVSEGQMIMTSLPAGNTVIAAGATFTLKNASWTGTADRFSGNGTLELYANTSDFSQYASTSSFAGKLKVIGNNSNVPYFNGTAPQFTAKPDFELDGNMTLTDRFCGSDKKFTVKNLTCTTLGRIDPYYTNTADARYVSTLQTRDTVCAAVFVSNNSETERKTGLYVYGQDATVHSLTLTGANTTRGPLEVDTYGKVVFSSTGYWYGPVTIGNNGYLQSDSTAATVAGTLTLEDGATVVRGSQPVKATALTALDANATIKIAFADGVTPADGMVVLSGTWADAPDATRFAFARSSYSDVYEFVVTDSGVVINEIETSVTVGGTEISVGNSWLVAAMHKSYDSGVSPTDMSVATVYLANKGLNGMPRAVSYLLGLENPDDATTAFVVETASVSSGEGNTPVLTFTGTTYSNPLGSVTYSLYGGDSPNNMSEVTPDSKSGNVITVTVPSNATVKYYQLIMTVTPK